MEEDDSARMNAAQQFVKGLFLCGLIVLVPVYVGEAPEEGVVAKSLCHFQVFHIVLPLGRTVKFCHLLSCDLFIAIFHTLQLFPEGFQGGNPGHIGVSGGVVGYRVSLFHHPADQIRVLRDEVSHYKKCSGSFMLFQSVQNGLGIAILITCIKGQVDPFLICIAQVEGIVLCQFIHSGISHGRLALLLEAKAPVSLG